MIPGPVCELDTVLVTFEAIIHYNFVEIHEAEPFKAFLGFTKFNFWPPSTRYSVDFRLFSRLRALVKSRFIAFFRDSVAQPKLIQRDQS